MKKIRIGGVPEHFNLPVHLAIENGDFSQAGIEVEWVDFPGGSGFMKEALRDESIDLCILLTEGIVTDILKGNESKIISGYINTSLTWGIHVKNSDKHFNSPFSIFDKKIAISRYGSGSHLMPIVHAMMEEKTISEHQFIEVRDIQGGIEALQNGTAEIFYWEKFTTKPHVQQGLLKRIGEFISPWPCFQIAATNRIIETESDMVSQFLKIVHQSNQKFMDMSEATKLVANRYQQDFKDVERWFHATEWATNGWVSNKMLEGVIYSLKEANIIGPNAVATNLVWERNKKQ
ncbi:ABC transporter substrate-binding protein [Ekhidna sp.]|uniref:ABC transporter substrate-binding protein n=1 Tax=Ekhidna sp. TaxID=2608089 RepID=UPI003B50E564